jgi:hypothetical protein
MLLLLPAQIAVHMQAAVLYLTDGAISCQTYVLQIVCYDCQVRHHKAARCLVAHLLVAPRLCC